MLAHLKAIGSELKNEYDKAIKQLHRGDSAETKNYADRGNAPKSKQDSNKAISDYPHGKMATIVLADEGLAHRNILYQPLKH